MLDNLEVDVMSQNELRPAIDLAVKYQLPALVINQALVGEAAMLRIARQGRFKIFTPVDWPKVAESQGKPGTNYGMLKLRGMVTSAIQADGFEILLTPDQTVDATQAEAEMLIEFFKNQVSRTTEVRFVLHMLHDELASLAMYGTLLNIRRPAMVRTDWKTKTQVGKHGSQIHQGMVLKLKSIANLPIKVSGNVSSWRAVQDCKTADRIAVSLSQLETIIKDQQRTPLEIKELLT